MLLTRVIPCLLLRDGGLVKGSRYRNHKYVGDPINTVKIFNDKEVDEIVFLDINATARGNGPNYELLSDIASQAFMPFAYGGGISTVVQVERLLKLGVEKVVVNSLMASNPSLVTDMSRIAGSQSIVVSIDVKKARFGGSKTFTHSGTRSTGKTPVELAQYAESLGAGEILLSSIDREGTSQGYDLRLVQEVASAVDIPVIASGGAGKLADFQEGVKAGASAVSAGDMFTFYGRHKAVLITYPEYSVLENLFAKSKE